MKSLKGTKTEKNLLASFAGESQARNRYTYFSKQAEKDGFDQIAAVFLETAEQERIHAKSFFTRLEGGDVEITAAYPAGVIGTTLENLKAAAAGEHHEQAELYPQFAHTAREEGFPEIGALYENVAKAELGHEQRYARLAKLVAEGAVFKRPAPVRWRCRKCGWWHEGTEAPEQCASCAHPRAYFEVYGEHL